MIPAAQARFFEMQIKGNRLDERNAAEVLEQKVRRERTHKRRLTAVQKIIEHFQTGRVETTATVRSSQPLAAGSTEAKRSVAY